jgi:hypothetical protein
MGSGSLDRADHLVDSKVGTMGVTEKLEIIRQLLDADEVNMRTLGRYAAKFSLSSSPCMRYGHLCSRLDASTAFSGAT